MTKLQLSITSHFTTFFMWYIYFFFLVWIFLLHFFTMILYYPQVISIPSVPQTKKQIKASNPNSYTFVKGGTQENAWKPFGSLPLYQFSMEGFLIQRWLISSPVWEPRTGKWAGKTEVLPVMKKCLSLMMKRYS